jgi:hypothetical protein
MVQLAHPIADSTVTEWVEGVGDGDADAFDELSTLTDTDYWVTTDEKSGANVLECNVTPLTDPEVSSGHIIRTRVRKNASGGRQLDLEHALYENTTLRFIDTSNTDIGASFVTYAYTALAAEADAITDYSVLERRVGIYETGGGPPRVGHCAWVEFECPDAPGTPGGSLMLMGVGR